MKSTILTLSILLSGFFATAQNSGDVVLFSESGDKFTLYLNNVKQNTEPRANVKVTGLTAEFYKARMVFEGGAIPEINKNLMVHHDYEITYMVKMLKSGSYGLRFRGEVPLAEAAQVPEQQVIEYGSAPAPVSAPAVESQVKSTQTTTTTTTTSSGGSSMGMGGVSIGISVDENGNGGSVGININDPISGESMTTTTTTTTTMTTSGDIDAGWEASSPSSGDGEVVTEYLPGYTGRIGCDQPPMDASSFNAAKNSISAKSFAESKMTVAKQVARGNCLLSTQVRDIMQLFSFEDDKLDFAKFAYSYTYDLDNYYKVNDAFDFELTIEELDEHIQGK